MSNPVTTPSSIRRLLVANRGEIARRIFRSCRKLDITPLAVFSEADRYAMHVREAAEARCVGSGEPRESYLNFAHILDVAKELKADAIHPGYGFLSENPEFAAAVSAAGITFIGPSPEAMRKVGDKLAAKQLAARAQVPMSPSIEVQLGASPQGTPPTIANQAALDRFVQETGLPLIVKAAGGGGGRGMRKVFDRGTLVESIQRASQEAASSFGNGSVFCEKLIQHARHIEVQVLADAYDNVWAVGDRDCTLQRRHQKIIEEAPAPQLSPATRHTLHDAAVRLMRAAGYRSAGTVEFLLDSHGNVYFLEVNSRLQVEHPVTELIFGLDLVALQIGIAEGKRLTDMVPGGIPQPSGHAIEARLCAEDPAQDFQPSVGRISHFAYPRDAHASPKPHTIRVDSGYESGSRVPHHYDSLLAKVIVHGGTRSESIALLEATLSECLVEGVKTNRSLLSYLLSSPEFHKVSHAIDGLSTIPELIHPEQRMAAAVTTALLPAFIASSPEIAPPPGPWERPSITQNAALNRFTSRRYEFEIDSSKLGLVFTALSSRQLEGSSFGAWSFEALCVTESPSLIKECQSIPKTSPLSGELRLTWVQGMPHASVSTSTAQYKFIPALDFISCLERGEPTWLHSSSVQSASGLPPSSAHSFQISAPLKRLKHHSEEAGSGVSQIKSHLPGKVVSVHTTSGAQVSAGELLVILESMKMEHRIEAPMPGTVQALSVSAGESVEAGRLLVTLEASP